MGFFFDGKPPKQAQGGMSGNIPLETLHSLECSICTLKDEPNVTPHMPSTGVEEPLVYILGEAPGEQEDEEGRQFVGHSGQLLRRHLPGWFQKKYVRWNNVVRTRPPDNRNPTQHEIECCRPSVERDIAAAKPAAIWGMGLLPARWALEQTYPGITADRHRTTLWRGRRFMVCIGGHWCWFYPMQHPAFILRMRKARRDGSEMESHYEPIFQRDVRRAVKEARAGLPGPKPEPKDSENLYRGVKVITGQNGQADLDQLKHELDVLAKQKAVGIDIETKGLRPYAPQAKLLSVAVGTYKRTVALALDHSDARWSPQQLAKVHKLLKAFLYNGTAKIAHNLIFELEWFCYTYGVGLAHATTWHDTMAQAFVLDSRKGGHALEFLCAQYFGFDLKNQSNLDRSRLDAYSIEPVLYYNALDTKYTHKLFRAQNRDIKRLRMQHVYDLQNRRCPNLVVSQIYGAPVSQKKTRKLHDELVGKISEIDKKIERQKPVKRYQRKYGAFNPGSDKQVMQLFKDVLRRPEVEIEDPKTGKTRYSCDESVLSQIDLPVAQLILERRGLVKINSTYIEPALIESNKHVWPDGKMHTNFKHLWVVTGRLSSEDPPIQTYPKRKNPWVRKIVRAPKGYRLLAVDYGQIEARVIAMASRDKILWEAIWNSYDIHTEWAERIAHHHPKRIGGKRFLKDKQVMKNLRTDIKNQWTFPLFYGASLFAVSNYLGIEPDIVEPLYEEFWETFEGVKEWQQGLLEKYEEDGYIECLTGRRIYAPIEQQKIINYPIQGSSSDIVVEAMNRLSYMAYKTGRPQFQARLNIHDDLTFLIPTATFEEDKAEILTEMVRPTFDWINVPLMVEPSIGKDWFKLEEVDKYTSTDANFMDMETARLS